MEPEGSLPHSQVPATCPCPELARSSPNPTPHFLKIHLNVIIQSMFGSPKWSLSLSFPTKTSLLSHKRQMSGTTNSSRLKKSNKMQQYADIYLLLNYSTCLGLPWSGVHTTAVGASGTDRTVWGASFFKRDQIRTCLRLTAAATVLCAPDDGRDGRPKHVE